ncbi:hypothetical protein H5410_056125, partial [Solanum commersonii]
CTNQNQKFYGGSIVWVYIITRSLYGDNNSTRVILVRVMGNVASAIDRAYEIVHIIFGRKLKCFVVDLAVVHDMVAYECPTGKTYSFTWLLRILNWLDNSIYGIIQIVVTRYIDP